MVLGQLRKQEHAMRESLRRCPKATLNLPKRNYEMQQQREKDEAMLGEALGQQGEITGCPNAG